MTFQEIEDIAFKGQMMPGGLTQPEQLAFQSIRFLYGIYRKGLIDRDCASKEKASIKIEFDIASYDYQRKRAMYQQYQYNIRKAGEYVNELCKKFNAGDGSEVLLLTAIQCISVLTDDQALINHFGMEANQ